jgi:hypothetical protein
LVSRFGAFLFAMLIAYAFLINFCHFKHETSWSGSQKSNGVYRQESQIADASCAQRKPPIPYSRNRRRDIKTMKLITAPHYPSSKSSS